MSGRRGAWLELGLLLLSALAFFGGAVPRLLAPDPWAPAERTPELLRVLSWNVGEGVDAGGGGLRDEHLAEVAATLERIDPDLAFLQEVSSLRQLQRLRELLGPGWEVEGSRRGRGRRHVVLVQRGNLGMQPVSEVDLGLVVTYERSGQTLRAAALHAPAFSAEERNRTIGATLTALFEGWEGVPRLFAGDLNLDLDLDKRRDLFSDDEYLDVETYNYVGGRLRDLGRGTGPTAEPDRRLDYLFATPGAFEVLSVGPLAGERRGGMDHHPLIADLRWRPGSAAGR